MFVLQQQDVGMDGPLVDAEGFPRADIDVYSVRHARHSIICESIGLYTISCIIVMKINIECGICADG